MGRDLDETVVKSRSAAGRFLRQLSHGREGVPGVLGATSSVAPVHAGRRRDARSSPVFHDCQSAQIGGSRSIRLVARFDFQELLHVET